MAKLKLKAGDTISRTVTIKDSSGTAIDITGGTVKIKIAKNLSNTDAEAEYTGTLTLSDPTNGVATWSVTKAVTELWTPDNYKWELEYIDASTNYSHTDSDNCIIFKSMFTNG